MFMNVPALVLSVLALRSCTLIALEESECEITLREDDKDDTETLKFEDCGKDQGEIVHTALAHWLYGEPCLWDVTEFTKSHESASLSFKRSSGCFDVVWIGESKHPKEEKNITSDTWTGLPQQTKFIKFFNGLDNSTTHDHSHDSQPEITDKLKKALSDNE